MVIVTEASFVHSYFVQHNSQFILLHFAFSRNIFRSLVASSPPLALRLAAFAIGSPFRSIFSSLAALSLSLVAVRLLSMPVLPRIRIRILFMHTISAFFRSRF